MEIPKVLAFRFPEVLLELLSINLAARGIPDPAVRVKHKP